MTDLSLLSAEMLRGALLGERLVLIACFLRVCEIKDFLAVSMKRQWQFW